MGIETIVMCKAPVAGKVKTRLMAAYSSDEATAIHMAMATTVIERAARMFPHTSIAADDVSHPFFTSFNLPLLAQGDGDLGERMCRLMNDAFQTGAEAVLFLGTDSPHMAESRLEAAVEALSGHNVVVGPVEDGGYDLIAMRQPLAELFSDIRWGSEYVLQETLKHADRAGISIGQLDIGFDLDTPESLERARPLWSPSTITKQV